MKLGPLTLAIALAGLAASVLMKNRRDGLPARPDFVDTEPSGFAPDAADSGDTGADADGLGASGAAPAVSGMAASGMATSGTGASGAGASGSGAESANPAERLQATQKSALAEAVEGTSDDLFDSNSQDGPYPRTPGLPDLTRGA
jgi:hypothetical protein